MSDSPKKRPRQTSSGPPAKRPAAGNLNEPPQEEVYGFDITFDPVDSNDGLPADIDAQYGELFDLVHNDPTAAIARLELLVQQFPAVPRLANLLMAAYSGSGQVARADELIRASYEKFPDYLFARIHYAQGLLERGEVEAVPGVFGGDFNLRRMYPDRTEFHVSEVAGLYTLVGEYLARRGEFVEADRCLALLKEIAPDHPGTAALERRLLMAVMERAMDGLAGRGRPRTRRPRAGGSRAKPRRAGEPPRNSD